MKATGGIAYAEGVGTKLSGNRSNAIVLATCEDRDVFVKRFEEI